MSKPLPPPWDDIRQAYVETSEPLKSLTARFGISSAELAKARKAHGWPTRPSPIVKKSANAPAQKPTRKKSKRSKTRKGPRTKRVVKKSSAPPPLATHLKKRPATNHRAIAKRLATLIAKKLERMEQQIANAELPSIADSEREARALGVMIQNLERLIDLHFAPPREDQFIPNDTAVNSDHASDPTVDAQSQNLDQLRRDLAQRIDRLGLARRADNSPSEPDAQ
jgi:hypothetical protein